TAKTTAPADTTAASATTISAARLLIRRLHRRRQRHLRARRLLDRLHRLRHPRRETVADVVQRAERQERRRAVADRAAQLARFLQLPRDERPVGAVRGLRGGVE